MDTTLCLVDAQIGFWENAGKIENQLIHTLEDALERRHKLVVLEYTIDRYRKTHPSLMKVIDNFLAGDVCFVEKHDDDGSKEAYRAIASRGFPRNVRICGVNRCYCVYETATSLSSGFCLNVELVSDSVSCWNWCDCEAKHEGLARILDCYRYTGVEIN